MICGHTIWFYFAFTGLTTSNKIGYSHIFKSMLGTILQTASLLVKEDSQKKIMF